MRQKKDGVYTLECLSGWAYAWHGHEGKEQHAWYLPVQKGASLGQKCDGHVAAAEGSLFQSELREICHLGDMPTTTMAHEAIKYRCWQRAQGWA